MIGMLKGRSAGAAAASQSQASAAPAAEQQAGQPSSANGTAGSSGEVLSALLDTHLLADRHKAFEVFRKSYKQGEVRTPHTEPHTSF